MLEYIIVSEFAKRAGVTRQAVHQAREEGRIKDFKKLGPIFLISSKELKKFKGGKREKG